MNSKRLYWVLIGSISLLVVGLAAGTYGANKLLSSRATHLVSLKAQSSALDQEQLSLNKAKKEIQTYSSLVKITKSVVPEDKDQAEAVREIVNIAEEHGIGLTSVTFPASSLGAITGTSTATTTAPTASASSNAASNKKAALSQLSPVKNIPGVYVLQINVASDATKPVPYSQFISFLSDLEHNRRTAQVSTIALNPDKNNSSLLSFTLEINEYIKP